MQTPLRGAFPKLVSYSRFIWLATRVRATLERFQRSRQGVCDGVTLLDSTALPVCDNHCIGQHRVLAGPAQRGKTSMGWFYGFKLHWVTNAYGELLSLKLAKSTVADRQPLPQLAPARFGKLYGDKGDLSPPLFDQLQNISQLEHTRPRSPLHFLVNLLAGLRAYTHQPAKPALSISRSVLTAVVP